MPLQSELAMLQPGADEAANSIDKLRALILGKNADLQQAKNLAPVEAQAAGMKQAATNTANMNTMKELSQNAPDGAMVKVGDLATGTDPYAHMMTTNIKGEEAARQKAIGDYNKSAPQILQQMSKIHEGLSAVNDPNQIGSAGAAKTLLISGVGGMNRYNEQEGGSVVPSTWFQRAQQITNSLGDDANPLSPAQRQSINSLFLEGNAALKNRHEALKQNAMSHYSMSRFANSDGMNTLGGIGAPVDNQFKQYDQEYSKYAQPPQAPVSPDQRSGVVGGIADLLFGRRQAPAPNPAPAAPAQPDFRAAVAAERAKRAAKKVK